MSAAGPRLALLLCAAQALPAAATPAPPPGIVADVQARGMPIPNIVPSHASRFAQEHELEYKHQVTRKALADRVRRATRRLYRLTRAGQGLLFTGDVARTRRHLSRLRHLRRALRNDLEKLAVVTTRSTPHRSAVKQQLPPSSPPHQNGHGPRRLRRADNHRLPRTPSTTDSTDRHPLGVRTHIASLDSARSLEHTTFGRNYGRLPHPVSRHASLRHARRQAGRGVMYELPASDRTAVRAVAAGTVSFAGHDPDYGQVVVLEHGEGFYTLYAGLNQLQVLRGDVVSAKASVGQLAASADQRQLYFEVRHDQQSLPARRWLSP